MTDYGIPTLERTIDGRRSMRSIADALEALRDAGHLPAGSFLEIRIGPLPARTTEGPSIVLIVCHANTEETWGVALPTSYEFTGRPLGNNASKTFEISLLDRARSLIVGTAKDKSTGRRIPASNLETLIITKLRNFLANEGAVLNVIRKEHVDGAAQSRLIARGVKIAKEIESVTPDRIRVMLMTLIRRVDIRPDCVEISVRRSRLVELLGSGSIELVTQQGTPDNEAKDILMLTVRARLQRVGREMKMLVENADDQTEADPALLRIVARAHDIQERLMQKGGVTLHAIASQEHVTPGYVSRLLRLSSLAPDIITAIVNGKNPPQLTAKKLMRLALEIPVDWTAQRKLFGFHAR